jgi:hypothetical protein
MRHGSRWIVRHSHALMTQVGLRGDYMVDVSVPPTHEPEKCNMVKPAL